MCEWAVRPALVHVCLCALRLALTLPWPAYLPSHSYKVETIGVSGGTALVPG